MTTPAVPLLEMLLRGAAIGLNLFIGLHFAMRPKSHPAIIPGMLFAVGIAIHAFLSSPAARPWSPQLLPLIFLATFNSGLFWLFASALFKDRLVRNWTNAAAFFVMPALFAAAILGPQEWQEPLRYLMQAAAIVIYVSVFAMALKDFRGDLVDARRGFRAAVAVLIPVTGLLTALGEMHEVTGPVPDAARLLQAAAIAVLSLAFSLWVTRTGDVFAAERVGAMRISAGEQAELDRLTAAISGGALFAEELSIGRLAELVRVPEHRLRRIINQQLGYRNFAAFLNDHRIGEARLRLADPQRARDQIVQVAYGLGYASLAPFNRAFRERTGKTPTEFRAEKLARPAQN